MPVLTGRIPANRESVLAIELLQHGLESEATVVKREGGQVEVEIVGPLGKAGAALNKAGGSILYFAEKVKMR